MNSEDKKRQKRNITLMIILALLGIIGIASRWQQTKIEIKNGIEHYLSTDSTNDE